MECHSPSSTKTLGLPPESQRDTVPCHPSSAQQFSCQRTGSTQSMGRSLLRRSSQFHIQGWLWRFPARRCHTSPFRLGFLVSRSEERRVGKEGSAGVAADAQKK